MNMILHARIFDEKNKSDPPYTRPSYHLKRSHRERSAPIETIISIYKFPRMRLGISYKN